MTNKKTAQQINASQTTIAEIFTGDDGADYTYGDFLNAVNALVCWYEYHRGGFRAEKAAKYLRLLADDMEGN